jgi:hypothetical protein
VKPSRTRNAPKIVRVIFSFSWTGKEKKMLKLCLRLATVVVIAAKTLLLLQPGSLVNQATDRASSF